MKRLLMVLAAVMLTFAMVFSVGCKKKSTDTSDSGSGNSSGGGSTPAQTTKVCFGMIGFNDSLFVHNIDRFDTMWFQDFRDYLEETWPDERTKLLFSEYTALNMLQEAPAPDNLTNVSLVTYINGLDRVSLESEESNPMNYSSNEEYLEALVDRIFDNTVHGLNIDSYVIGHVNDDVQGDLTEFRDVMTRLSTDEKNIHEVNSLEGVENAFQAVADSINEAAGSGGRIVMFVIDCTPFHNNNGGANHWNIIEKIIWRILPIIGDPPVPNPPGPNPPGPNPPGPNPPGPNPPGPGDIPEGAVNGTFSVSATERVFFSHGNLQYCKGTHELRFTDNQWEFIGAANTHIDDPGFTGWVDVFSWGTGYNPACTYDTSQYYINFIDWGLNPIANGGNTQGLWRTLSANEWNYVVYQRETPSGIRFALGQVEGNNGLILLPDEWDSSIYDLENCNNDNIHGDLPNVMSESDWAVLNENGAVFLPCAGRRNNFWYYGNGQSNHTYEGENLEGCYWSNTIGPDQQASPVELTAFSLNVGVWYGLGAGLSIDAYSRAHSLSVRLVQDAIR